MVKLFPEYIPTDEKRAWLTHPDHAGQFDPYITIVTCIMTTDRVPGMDNYSRTANTRR